MSEPIVSVILPVYNGENYVRSAVDSVLSQTLRDYELIVVDDGSTDSTPAVLREYGDRVKYVRQENTGVAGAFNHGIRLAGGRYISWLSHDDIFMPTKLEKQIEAITRVSGDAPAACYTDVQMIDPEGKLTKEHRIPEYDRHDLLRQVLTIGAIAFASYSILYDRRCIDIVGFYSEELRYAQDIDMLSRLARHFPLVHVPEILMQVREHPTRASRTKSWEREVITYFPDRLGSLPFEELFPHLGDEASNAERSEAYLGLGDVFASHPPPLYRVAFSQYRRALRENPADALRLFRRMAGLYRLHLRRRFEPRG